MQVPTEAWAYQVPRVPWRANTSVSASVYSARCSSGTAQSSMKLTGLPSPLRLIMMLRPALRTSHSAFCAPRRASRPRAWAAQVAHQLDQAVAAAASRARAVVAANSTSRMAAGWPISAVSITGRNAGFWRASSIIVRSTSSTALGPG
jgi:hypothetical protein